MPSTAPGRDGDGGDGVVTRIPADVDADADDVLGALLHGDGHGGSSTTTRALDDDGDTDPWAHRLFLSDGRLRCRERYSRRRLRRRRSTGRRVKTMDARGPGGGVAAGARQVIYLLPDAKFWREYLPLVERFFQVDNVGNGDSSSSRPPLLLRWVLLESAAEALDARTTSPGVVMAGDAAENAEAGAMAEAAATNERSRICRLVEDSSSRRRRVDDGGRVICDAVALPDLSIRTTATTWRHDEHEDDVDMLDEDEDEDEDEFDLLGYGDMPTLSMCQRALGRAARFVKLECATGERESYPSPTSPSSSPPPIVEVVILSDDPSVKREVALEEEEEDRGGRDTITVLSGGEELISFLRSHLDDIDDFDDVDDDDRHVGSNGIELGVLSSLRETAIECEAEYRRRNSPRAVTDSSLLAARFGSDYFPHWSPEEVRRGLESRGLFRGKLDVERRNVREGYVTVHGVADGPTMTTRRYFLDQSRRMFNRALPGDVVVVEPLPEGLWRVPVGRRRLVHHTDADDESSPPLGPPVPTARVVAVLRPHRRTYVATIVEGDDNRRKGSTTVGGGGGGDAAILVVPMDMRVPKIRIRPRGTSSLRDHRLLIRVDGWDVDSDYPNGHVESVIGPCNDLETEVSCLLHECDLDDVRRPFGPAALACLPSVVSDETVESGKWTIPHGDLAGRRDLRGDTSEYRVFSVDPEGCQDIDDTMHVRRLSNGNVEIGVHIADVDHFLPRGCALDREAALRGTTFYLVDRRYDMLPSVLSSNLCSLHGGVDRLAVSCVWELEWPSSPGRGGDGGGGGAAPEVKSCWFGRTVIRNCAAMTYEQAHQILEGKDPDNVDRTHTPPPLTAGGPVDPRLVPLLRRDLAVLTDLARQRRTRRESEGGAIDLSGGGGERGSELKFTLDPDTGEPVQVTGKTEMEIHATVAELMIMANAAVAQRIYGRFPLTALLRTHRPVEDELKLDELDEAFRAASGGEISLLHRDGDDGDGGGGTKMTLAGALRKARGDAALEALFQSLAARAMSEARYVCTGTVLEEAARQGGGDRGELFSHYGLGIDEYTHFTSPIRRYADVVVHRLLLASLLPETGSDVGRPEGGSSDHRLLRRRGEDDAVPKAEVVPVSNVISVLRGVGHGDPTGGSSSDYRQVAATTTHHPPSDFSDDDGDAIDELIEGAADLALGDVGGTTSPSMASSTNADDAPQQPAPRAAATAVTMAKGGGRNVADDGPYGTGEVAAICDRLNHQNRMSKIASTDCQNLFLSLYLMGHVEYAEAVVVGLRQNGVLVYVPRFDLKAPLYLSDRDGNVHIDPGLVGLPPSAGLPPSSGFAAVGAMRTFPNGTCTLHDADGTSDDEDEEGASWVGVSVPNGNDEFVVRRLDVLTVQLSSSDASESRARVPPPRVHLICKDRHPVISSPTGHRENEAHRTRVKSTSFGGKNKTNEENEVPNRMELRQLHTSSGGVKGNDDATTKSLYEITRSIEIIPDLVCCSRTIPDGSDESPGRIVKAADCDRVQTVPGRFVYRDFRNPDTATAMKEAVATAAAASSTSSPRRKNQGGGDSNTGYDESRRIERGVTARTQRLAAVKRSARRAKAGK